jgi:hypothetical protein
LRCAQRDKVGYTPRARGFQSTGQGVERGAGSHDVIDYTDVFAADVAQHSEGIADIVAARVEIELRLRRGIAGTLDQRCICMRTQPACR